MTEKQKLLNKFRILTKQKIDEGMLDQALVSLNNQMKMDIISIILTLLPADEYSEIMKIAKDNTQVWSNEYVDVLFNEIKDLLPELKFDNK